jgi:hypothetical protein
MFRISKKNGGKMEKNVFIALVSIKKSSSSENKNFVSEDQNVCPRK